MNRVFRRHYRLTVDVFEPFNKHVDTEMDTVVKALKSTLVHGANIHMPLEKEELL